MEAANRYEPGLSSRGVLLERSLEIVTMDLD